MPSSTERVRKRLADLGHSVDHLSDDELVAGLRTFRDAVRAEGVSVDTAISAALAIGRIFAGVEAFAADMRSQGIHVGLGSPGRCVTCFEVWPCSASV